MCASCLAFIPCSASSTLGQFSLFFFVLPTCAVLTLRFVSHHLLMKTHCFALWPMAQPHIGAKLFSRPYSPICNFFLTCLDLPIFHLCGFSRPDFDTPTAPKLRKNVKHQRRWLRGSQGSSKSPNVHHTWAPPPKNTPDADGVVGIFETCAGKLAWRLFFTQHLQLAFGTVHVTRPLACWRQLVRRSLRASLLSSACRELWGHPAAWDEMWSDSCLLQMRGETSCAVQRKQGGKKINPSLNDALTNCLLSVNICVGSF